MKSFETIRALGAMVCLSLMTAGCVTTEDEGAAGRDVARSAEEVSATLANPPPAFVFEAYAVPDAHPCVDEGCSAGLSCDWVQGCTEEVLFCCADDQCGEGRFCDFDAGGECADLP